MCTQSNTDDRLDIIYYVPIKSKYKSVRIYDKTDETRKDVHINIYIYVLVRAVVESRDSDEKI